MILIIVGAVAIFGSFLGNFNPVAFVLGAGMIAAGFKLIKDGDKIIDKSYRKYERIKADFSSVGKGRRELTALLKDKINESGGLWTVYYGAKYAPEIIQITNQDGIRTNLILEEYDFPVLGPAANDIFYRIADDMGGEVTIDRKIIDSTPPSCGGYIWTGDGIAVEAVHRTDKSELISITVRSKKQIQERNDYLKKERKRIQAERTEKKKIY